jgi:hypothetical protein
MLAQQDELEVHGRRTTALHITVKRFEQFAMDVLEVLADHYASVLGFSQDDVDDLAVDFVPEQFRVTTE